MTDEPMLRLDKLVLHTETKDLILHDAGGELHIAEDYVLNYLDVLWLRKWIDLWIKMRTE